MVNHPSAIQGVRVYQNNKDRVWVFHAFDDKYINSDLSHVKCYTDLAKYTDQEIYLAKVLSTSKQTPTHGVRWNLPIQLRGETVVFYREALDSNNQWQPADFTSTEMKSILRK